MIIFTLLISKNQVEEAVLLAVC